ncbi:hypothetical protein Tco_1246855 [Tanacetum coccineum]
MATSKSTLGPLTNTTSYDASTPSTRLKLRLCIEEVVHPGHHEGVFAAMSGRIPFIQFPARKPQQNNGLYLYTKYQDYHPETRVPLSLSLIRVFLHHLSLHLVFGSSMRLFASEGAVVAVERVVRQFYGLQYHPEGFAASPQHLHLTRKEYKPYVSKNQMDEEHQWRGNWNVAKCVAAATKRELKIHMRVLGIKEDSKVLYEGAAYLSEIIMLYS